MHTYELTGTGESILRSDGAFIPCDAGNADYVDYLAWLAAGGVATPSITIIPQPDAQALADKIDDLVASIYQNWARFQQEYMLRASAAQAFKDAEFQGDPGPWITGFATPAGLSNKDAADRILSQSASLNGALIELGAQRMRKYEVLNATSADEAGAAYLSVVAAINAVVATHDATATIQTAELAA